MEYTGASDSKVENYGIKTSQSLFTPFCSDSMVGYACVSWAGSDLCNEIPVAGPAYTSTNVLHKF